MNEENKKVSLDEIREAYQKGLEAQKDYFEQLLNECDYDTKLAVTAWVMENIVTHAKEGGSFRYLIYTRLGFNTDAYVPLYDAGGMVISNEFDLNTKDELRKVAKDNCAVLKGMLFSYAKSFTTEPGLFLI